MPYYYVTGRIEIDFMNDETWNIDTRRRRVEGVMPADSPDAVREAVERKMDTEFPVRWSSRIPELHCTPLNVGDRVHWTKSSARGRTLSVQRREGTILSFNGETALIKTSGKKPAIVQVGALRPMDAPSELSRVMDAVRRSAVEE